MPIINVKLIEDVFTPDQKREIIERLTDAMVSIEGENMRPVTWVVVEEVASGDMGVGGKPLSTEDVKALAADSRVSALSSVTAPGSPVDSAGDHGGIVRQACAARASSHVPETLAKGRFASASDGSARALARGRAPGVSTDDRITRGAKLARADPIESRVEFEAGPAANNPGPRAVLRRHAPSATRQRTLEANGIDRGAGPVLEAVVDAALAFYPIVQEG